MENRISLRVTLKTNDQIEEEVQKLFTDIQQCVWEVTPLVTKNIKGINYPKEEREIIAENEIRKNWQTTRDPRIKTELNRITQDLRRTVNSSQLKLAYRNF